MKALKQIIVSAALAAVSSGCISDNPFYSKDGEGTLYLTTTIQSDVIATVSRAEGAGDEVDPASCDVWLANAKGLVKEFRGLDAVPSGGIKLVSGQYYAMVWAGDSVPASWTSRYYRGYEEFEIEAGSSKAIEVEAKIANVVVDVQFPEEMEQSVKDYTLSVGHSQGKLDFPNREIPGAKGYFMMNSRDKNLDWTLTVTRLDDTDFTVKGTLEEVKPAYLYTLKVMFNEQSADDTGGAFFDIEISEDEIEQVDHNITILSAPQIVGIDFDITKKLSAQLFGLGAKSVWIGGTSKIVSLDIESEYFKTLFGVEGFDFIKMGDNALKDQIFASGLTYVYDPNQQPDGSEMPTIRLTFDRTFTDRLDEGEYQFIITVEDANGKESQATLLFAITSAVVEANEINERELAKHVWATEATVSLTVVKEGVERPLIKYRPLGTTQWSVATATTPTQSAYHSGEVVMFDLKGLQPGTTYQYTASYDDGTSEGVVYTFTTEEARQLPNSSFENWDLSGKTYRICNPGENVFWSSGNKGSAEAVAIISVNVTVPTSISSRTKGMKKTGENAISLESQFVGVGSIGAFAAGNVFIGEFLGTDGTNGILGWGRSFDTRPRQVKVWASYKSSKIEKRSNNAPGEYQMGDADRGIIYVALMDGNTETYNGENYAAIIRTKDAGRLFDASGSDKPHVIAYGEHVFDSSSPATNDNTSLVEITIDLDYDNYGYPNKDVRPTYIILTASASKGGDYFTGGLNSTLVLDDIELVY